MRKTEKERKMESEEKRDRKMESEEKGEFLRGRELEKEREGAGEVERIPGESVDTGSSLHIPQSHC